MMGTPAYMAPEQVLGREIDGRADLYSVGVVLYRLLSGHLPFNADTAISMVQMQISEAPTPIATFRPDLPGWCSAIVDRALAKSPSDRFQSAEEFRAALIAAVTPQALGEMPTIATPTPPGLAFDPEMTAPHRTPTLMRTSSAIPAVPRNTTLAANARHLADANSRFRGADADEHAAAREDDDGRARPDSSDGACGAAGDCRGRHRGPRVCRVPGDSDRRRVRRLQRSRARPVLLRRQRPRQQLWPWRRRHPSSPPPPATPPVPAPSTVPAPPKTSPWPEPLLVSRRAASEAWRRQAQGPRRRRLAGARARGCHPAARRPAAARRPPRRRRTRPRRPQPHPHCRHRRRPRRRSSRP